MKLILANNQSTKFQDFYRNLRTEEVLDYLPYNSLVYIFDNSKEKAIDVISCENNKSITSYSSVYINGYLNTYELAATTAIVCDYLNIEYVNKELSNPPSLSKLSMYAKLASNKVPLPKTIGGTKNALLKAKNVVNSSISFPAVLKRADADRGVDNYLVESFDAIIKCLEPFQSRSLWLIQDFIKNDGFYLVTLYNYEPKFCIFRSLEERLDNNKLKAHMFKPKGGANARLIDIVDVPKQIIDASINAAKAMNRQIASVDSLFNPDTKAVKILEVNYNPQLVSIETFKDARIKAFTDYINTL